MWLSHVGALVFNSLLTSFLWFLCSFLSYFTVWYFWPSISQHWTYFTEVIRLHLILSQSTVFTAAALLCLFYRENVNLMASLRHGARSKLGVCSLKIFSFLFLCIFPVFYWDFSDANRLYNIFLNINVQNLYWTILLTIYWLCWLHYPPSSSPLSCLLQAVLGGERPLLWLGLQAAQMHHTGGQLQHEPVEAEHHCLPGKSAVMQHLL